MQYKFNYKIYKIIPLIKDFITQEKYLFQFKNYNIYIYIYIYIYISFLRNYFIYFIIKLILH